MASKTKRPSPILNAASAMIGDASARLVTRESHFRHSFELDVHAIRPDPAQARKIFAEQEIRALAASLEEQGQLQPILVRRDMAGQGGSWIIVAGERRWRAAQLLGLSTIVCIEHDGDADVAALIENIQRVDLTPVEEAKGLQRLIDEKGWAQIRAAEAIGKTQAEVSATLRILSLPEAFLEELLTSQFVVPRNVLVELARVSDPRKRARLMSLARHGNLTVRAIRLSRDDTAEGHEALHVEESKSSRQFNLKSLDRVTLALQTWKAAGHSMHQRDRKRLENLRHEIDQLLADMP